MRSFLLLSAALLSAPAVAQEGDWIEMFNGKDLTGWKVSENGQIKAENGTIVISGPRSHAFYTGREFKDFVFEAEVKTEPNSNSGIYFHTKYQEEGWPAQGHEIQVNNTYKSDPVRSGSLYNRVKLFTPAFNDGEWATYRITVKGDTLRTEINDKVLYEYVQPPGVTEQPRFSQGLFALQAHDPGSVVRYRNLRVKSLDGAAGK
ncbi:MAG: DUF1080 domain-containing protein [Planctomycetaceae bacterium]